MRRDPQLIQKLLETLEAYPAKYGEVFILNGDDPLLAVDGFTSDEINYHRAIRGMGYLDSPGSQPMIGITFGGLSPSGHDFLDRSRAKTSLSSTTTSGTQVMSNKVFVVHGHDAAVKNEVAFFLTGLGLEPIILHLRPNGGRGLLNEIQGRIRGCELRRHIDDTRR